MKKETSSIGGYLRFLKTIADELNLIGYLLDDVNLILYYLSGLGFNFKDIATVLRSQPFLFMYDQIYEQLTNHELQLSHEEKNNVSVRLVSRSKHCTQGRHCCKNRMVIIFTNLSVLNNPSSLLPHSLKLIGTTD
ncbi:hypothetical protein L6164_023634 [Bauhinia variegata]|uniref:Uncharacterized protein n=1 Tax=Bauhinia variegata TaxID=167791 RepID=A0ACB9MKW8_BAUVA|nr:hypothetical protein L6164_023634 [Bauhinia variegata]